MVNNVHEIARMRYSGYANWEIAAILDIPLDSPEFTFEDEPTRKIQAYHVKPGMVIINQKDRTIRHTVTETQREPSGLYIWHTRSALDDTIVCQYVENHKLLVSKFEIED